NSPARVDLIRGIVVHVDGGAPPRVVIDRVLLHEPASPGIVTPRAVVMETALRIALTPRICRRVRHALHARPRIPPGIVIIAVPPRPRAVDQLSDRVQPVMQIVEAVASGNPRDSVVHADPVPVFSQE